jgi:hypothetical protein
MGRWFWTRSRAICANWMRKNSTCCARRPTASCGPPRPRRSGDGILSIRFHRKSRLSSRADLSPPRDPKTTGRRSRLGRTGRFAVDRGRRSSGPGQLGLGKEGPRIAQHPSLLGSETTGLKAQQGAHRHALRQDQQEKGEPEKDGTGRPKALATDLRRDARLAVSRRRAGHLGRSLAASPSRASRQLDGASRPSRPGRSPSVRNGRNTRGRLHLGRKLRGVLLLDRLMRLDRRSGQACTLSQFTRPRGLELTVRTLRDRAARNSGAQNRVARGQVDPARHVHSAARAGFPGHPPPAAASRAPVDHDRAANRAETAGDRSVQEPAAAGLGRVETCGQVEIRGAGKARQSFVPVARTPAQSARPVQVGSPSQALAARAKLLVAAPVRNRAHSRSPPTRASRAAREQNAPAHGQAARSEGKAASPQR